MCLSGGGLFLINVDFKRRSSVSDNKKITFKPSTITMTNKSENRK